MRKFLVLVAAIAAALAVDGTLSFDIFDPPTESAGFWWIVLLVITLFVVIMLADESPKKHDPEDNHK